jgi:hypothetical protein
LEPVIDPKETLKIIEETHEYVDHYKVGMWNYDERSKISIGQILVKELLNYLKN